MRYLVVGLGNIGQKRVALLGERCVATVDPVNRKADARSPQECALDDYAAAILAVPNEVKLELLEWFLARGKHVLVEKPLLFADRAQAERVERLAQASGAVYYTAYNHRFEPLIERLKADVEEGRIGRLYHGRLLYGNGTAGNVRGTWRDQGAGVLADLAPHLIDLVGYALGRPGTEFRPWTAQRHECAAIDQAILGSADGALTIEVSYLSWKNSFAIDLFGERGSMHLAGLRKWGVSELVMRERVLPSGVPRETRELSCGPDVTWQRELDHFEALSTSGATSVENDWWISQTINRVTGPC
jgi:predicted dehydrogenase